MNKIALQRAIFWCHMLNGAAAVVVTIGFGIMVTKIAGGIVVFTSGAMIYMGRVLKTGDVTTGDTTFTSRSEISTETMLANADKQLSKTTPISPIIQPEDKQK